MGRRTKAELEQENEELRRRVALLEETVHRLVTQPPAPQIVPIVVPCPAPAQPAAPDPWRVLPYSPYQPMIPLYPQGPIYPSPIWRQMPEIICGDQTTSVCAIH